MRFLSRIRESKVLKNILLRIVELTLLIYAFSLPSFGERTSIVHYVVYLAMAALGLFSFLYCFLYRKVKINALMFILVPFLLFSIIGTSVYSKDFRNWITVLLLVISFLIFIFSFLAIGNIDRILLIIASALFAFSIYYIYHYKDIIIHFSSLKSGRIGTYFDNENGISLYSSVGFASSLYVLIFTKKKWRFIFIVPCLSLSLVGFTSGSRTFYLLMFVVVIVYLYFILHKHKIIYAIIVVATALSFVGLLMTPFMNTIRERLISSIQTLFGTATRPDPSTIQRYVFMDYGLFLGSKNALIGYGCSGFRLFSGVGTYSHSNYAETICNFGIIGFLLFYIPFFIPIIYSFKYKMERKQIVVLFTIFYILFGISNVFYSNKTYYLILAVLYFSTFVEGRKKYEDKFAFQNVKKIVIVCDSLNAGGAERVIANLSNGLANRNINVTLVPLSNDTNCFYDINPNIKIENMVSNGSAIVRFFKKLSKLCKFLKKSRQDIIVSFLPLSNIYCFLASKLTKTRYIVSERNNPLTDPKNKLLRFLKNISFDYSEGCVFQTSFARDCYPEHIRNKSSIISNPFVASKELLAGKNKYPRIVSVGRLTDQKNYPLLFSAFQLFILNNHQNFILNIYGEGVLKDQLVAAVSELGIENNVCFLGNDPNWLEKEIDASAFVLPSKYEGMPNALLEALCSGIPCVSTDCPIGGPLALKEKGFYLELTSIDDASEMCRCIELCLDESHINQSIQNKEIAKLFSLDSIVDEWIELINTIKNQSLF